MKCGYCLRLNISVHYGAQKTESSKLRYTGSSAAIRMNMNQASKEKKPLD